MRPMIGRLVAAGALALAANVACAADTVRVGKAVGTAWTFIGVDVGMKEGIFQKYGIEVESTAFGGDAKLQQALASGGVDFGLGSGPAMAFAVKGAPIVAVASFANEPRDISIVVAAKSPINSTADLKGKLIAISTAGSLTDWLAKRVSLGEGWGTDGITRVAIGDAPAQTAALLSGQVDAQMGSTENGYQLEERGVGRVLVGMDKYVPHFVTHVIFARKDLVAEKPDVVDRFLKGFFATLAFIRTHEKETTEIAMPLQNESAAVLNKAWEHEGPSLILDGQLDAEGLALIKDTFVDMKVLDRKPSDDENPDAALPAGEAVSETPAIAIIGTGFGGIGMGVRLKQAGIDTFAIYGRADEVGGVWWENTYPGAACDVASSLYSFSFEPNFDWSRSHGTQPEIVAYLRHCVEKYGLGPHIHLKTEITALEFDEGRGLWRLEAADGRRFTAQAVVAACGLFNQPAYPDIPGLAEFRGRKFHSARWDHECDLAGKRVAVIGTGCSAAQFVPEIAEKVGRLDDVPAHAAIHHAQARKILHAPRSAGHTARFPLLRLWERARTYISFERRFGVQISEKVRAAAEQTALAFLARKSPIPEKRRKLTPTYRFGCKRTIQSKPI